MLASSVSAPVVLMQEEEEEEEEEEDDHEQLEVRGYAPELSLLDTLVADCWKSTSLLGKRVSLLASKWRGWLAHVLILKPLFAACGSA